MGRLFRFGIFTQGDEKIDGAGMEGIILLGKVTAVIVLVYEPSRPLI